MSAMEVPASICSRSSDDPARMSNGSLSSRTRTAGRASGTVRIGRAERRDERHTREHRPEALRDR